MKNRFLIIYLLITFAIAFRAISAEESGQDERENALPLQETVKEENQDNLSTENITHSPQQLRQAKKVTFDLPMQQPSHSLYEEGEDILGAEEIIKELETPGNEETPLPLQERIVRKDILWLERANITDHLLIKTVRLPEFRRLQFLFLSGNPIGDASIYAIGKNIPRLITLDLKESDISNEGVREIAKRLKHLRDLNLSYIPIKKSGAKAIGANLISLEKLTMVACQLPPTACKKLASGLPNIRTLNLAHNYFDHEGIQALLSNPHPYLISLNLTFNGVRDIEIMKLSTSEWFNNLRELSLSHNPVSRFTIKYICKHLQNLETLDLSHCNVKDEQVIIIAKKLLKLHVLNLEDNDITNKGVISLATAPFSELKMINALGNPIGEKGVKALEELREKKKGKTYIYWG